MPTDGTGNAKVQRRLAAILAADIAGYSKLMGVDEARTVRDLKAHQGAVLPMIDQFGGRIIDTAGDGILAEFGSVVNAVECAVAVQKTMAERNAEIDTARRMQFRIGINLGDVIHDDARVYGDGVNIAARLEAIAEPGGVCISGAAYDQVHKKLSLTFTDLGSQLVKNISEPVRVYRINIDQLAVPQAMAKPPLALPDKPSIAVLPFTNLSGDPSQDYFSDGITEDIITELSRFSELFVIARNSSFQYKGKSPDIRHVGRELGVRYVLEGSIRRGGDRVRITGQLIDAISGAHRWAERYDRELKDVFAVQDEVARTIVTILAVHINKAEAERTLLKPPATWQAYDFYMRAADTYASFSSSWKMQALYDARRLLHHSLSIDPNYARAYALLADTHVTAAVNPGDDDYVSTAALDRAHDFARKAVQLNPNLPLAHVSLGRVLTWKRQHDASIAEFERAVELNGNLTDWRFAATLVQAGQAARAIQVVKAHIRLDPFYAPSAPVYMGLGFYMLKRYSEAIPYLREGASRAPNWRGSHGPLAATYAQLGQLENARAEASEVLRIEPDYTIDRHRRLVPFKDPKDAEHFFDGMGSVRDVQQKL